jgi:N4-gp56 family major capsid protein
MMFIDTVKRSYFSRFMGGSDNVAYEKSDFTRQKGETMTFGIRMRATGTPITGNATVKGKEDRLTFYSYNLTLERYRYAIVDDGALTRQRFVGDIPQEIRDALVNWGAEQVDQNSFDSLAASPTSALYGGAATSTATLDATMLITPALISKARVYATTRRSASVIPLRPVRVDGKEYLVLLCSPDQIFDLKRNAEFQQAQREAAERGKDNPIFSGAVGVWDGVIIHEHDNTRIYSTGGAGGNVPYTHGMLLGAQALCWAWGERPSIVEEDEDYEEFKGFCWRMTSKCGKPQFNSQDYGSIAIYTADTRITGRTANIR